MRHHRGRLYPGARDPLCPSRYVLGRPGSYWCISSRLCSGLRPSPRGDHGAPAGDILARIRAPGRGRITPLYLATALHNGYGLSQAAMLYTMGQIVRYIGTTNSAPHAVISLPHARPKATLAVDPLGGGRDLLEAGCATL